MGVGEGAVIFNGGPIFAAQVGGGGVEGGVDCFIGK